MDAAAAHFETFSHVEVGDEFLEHGIFLPLAAWEAKGYDISAMEARSHASDVMEHPLLGKTFRVRLVSIRPSLRLAIGARPDRDRQMRMPDFFRAVRQRRS